VVPLTALDSTNLIQIISELVSTTPTRRTALLSNREGDRRLKNKIWPRCDGFLMSGSPGVHHVTSVCCCLPEDADSMVLSARVGCKSNTPHLNSTLQLAQAQGKESKGKERRGRIEERIGEK